MALNTPGTGTMVRRLKHPSGLDVRLPLLIPSFSSKGFRVHKDVSDIAQLIEFASGWLTEAFLVSAYDLHHKLIPQPSELPATPELIVVDSGGYETRIEHDLSANVHHPHVPMPWGIEEFREIMRLWPKRFPAAFVSYDHPDIRVPIELQIESARDMLEAAGPQLRVFLLKPETKTQKTLLVSIGKIAAVAHDLEVFDVIGATEEELGGSTIDRMIAIRQLREALDASGLNGMPIHVFGALDPLAIMLYFVAGAEIFDGLTWLRYGYKDAGCYYAKNYAMFEVDEDRDQLRYNQMLVANVRYLAVLRTKLVRFVSSNDYDALGEPGKLVAEWSSFLQARLGRRR